MLRWWSPRRVHYGWIITAASFVTGVTAYGVYYAFTLFYPLMVQEFGWSRAATSGALSVGLVAYAVFALPMGWLVDRIGPRLTIGVGGLLFGAGTFLGSLITDLWQLYILYGCITAIGMGAAWVPLVSTISRWFVRRRGLAIGIGSLGGGTGSFFVTPGISYLIVTYGWRQAYAIAGLGAGLLIIGAAMLMWRDPHSKDGGLPYGATTTATASAPQVRTVSAGLPLTRAMRTRAFWLMNGMFGLWWFGGSIIYVQLAPFMLEKEFDVRFAALAVTCFGAGNGVGKITMGALADRLGSRLSFSIATVVAVVAMVALVPTTHPELLLVGSFIFGLGFGGASPLITTVAVELFGLTSIGTLMGMLMAIMGTIGASGPVLSGYIFDRTGSYALAYLIGAGILGSAIIMAWQLRPPSREVVVSAPSHGSPLSQGPRER